MGGRDASGNLQWDTSKFPDGIAKLADNIHGKGLKLGIYETPSSTTCAGKTGGAGTSGRMPRPQAILTNLDIIAVDQDPLGKQGTRVATPGTNLEVWSKQLTGTNARAVALFNRSGSAASMTVKWTDIGIPAGSATVRDLYAQKDLGDSTDSYTATRVPSHGIVMLKIVSGS